MPNEGTFAEAIRKSQEKRAAVNAKSREAAEIREQVRVAARIEREAIQPNSPTLQEIDLMQVAAAKLLSL